VFSATNFHRIAQALIFFGGLSLFMASLQTCAEVVLFVLFTRQGIQQAAANAAASFTWCMVASLLVVWCYPVFFLCFAAVFIFV
jgi:hypothetical protein